MSNRRSSSYSPSMRMPGSSNPRPNRGIFALILCIAAPPLGLMFLWRMGVFRTRGRVVVTALATVEMILIGVLLTPQAVQESIAPVPGVPSRVTPAPESNVLTALSNMDEILRAQQEANGVQATQGPSAAEMLKEEEAERQAVMNTTVYAVYGSSAVRYHAAPVCGNQSNRRALTVAEAMSESLAACPDCNPPGLYGYSTTTGDSAE